MEQMSLILHAPVRRAVHGSCARHGTENYVLDDHELARIPADLRDELAFWLIDEEEPHTPPALELDSGEVSFKAIVTALRREQQARRTREAMGWLAKPNEEWLDWEDDIDARILDLADFPKIAERIEAAKALAEKRGRERKERAEKAVQSKAGLRRYAESIPEYARAAKEGYDVSGAAATHFVNAIAAHDEDAEILWTSAEAYRQSKFEERKAPDRHAFEVLDGIAAHLKRIPHPDGVEARIERVQRYRRAFKDSENKWRVDTPVTIVKVTVETFCTPAAVIVFFADAPDKLQFFREQAPF